MARLGGLVLALCSLVSIASAVAETPLQTLDEGLGLFREAASAAGATAAHSLYAEALLRLNLLVARDGVRNGRIFYDIGNTYERLGKVGWAILSYRRALLYRPHDPNLLHNLAYARSIRRDRLPAAPPPLVLRILLFWHYALSIPLQLWLFLVFFAAMWGFLCARLVTGRRNGARALPRWPVGAAGLVAALLLGSLVWRQVELDANRGGVIVVDSVVARRGDAPSYDPSFKHPLHAGTEFRLLSRRPEWYHVVLSNGARTWIPQGAARLVRPVAGG